MAVIVDTSFLIARTLEDDIDYERAKELDKELDTGRYGQILYTDFIVAEFLTLARRRKIHEEDIRREGKKLLDKKDNLIKSNEQILYNAFIIFSKYTRLSFVDAVTIAVANAYGINKIYSFDSDFDGVKGVERVF